MSDSKNIINYIENTTVEKMKPATQLSVWSTRGRIWRDQLSTFLVSLAGICVIASVVLIAIFLIYVVLPLFTSAKLQPISEYKIPDISRSSYLALDEYREEAVNILNDGMVYVFDPVNGDIEKRLQLANQGINISSLAVLDPIEEMLFFGLDDGRIMPIKIDYQVTYPNDRRHTDISILYPFGEEPLETGLSPLSIEQLSLVDTGDTILVAIMQPMHLQKNQPQQSNVTLLEYDQQTSFLDDSTSLELIRTIPINAPADIMWLGIDNLYSWLYVFDGQSRLHLYDIRDLDNISEIHTLNLQEYGALSKVSFLTGHLSLLIGFDSGRIIQVFPTRKFHDQAGSDDYQLRVIREFPKLFDSIVAIYPEYSRKGFFAADAAGNLGVYYSSNGEQLAQIQLPSAIQLANFAPRENAIIANFNSGKTGLISVDNEYPEVSFSSLWSQIWYESYDKPDYIWQSSASNNDFEPKFSLSPLTFGTIKAAFYAMLVATPLAIMAAIYTAFFLSPMLRQWVKPVIEIMEALPTVILGFLAGLWLAPFMEKNLAFIFSLILIVPLGVLAIGYGSSRVNRIASDKGLLSVIFSEEWRVLMLFPVVMLLGYFCWLIQPILQTLFFNGDMRSWLNNDLGISFDQRNALVIGAVMGFAVIPTIYSITEDAVFAVPKHLVNGSLALGASNWQTLVGVVLPTASPGIFSAVMIGMGRAVGETMIVLMATGNTPVMDFSIFEGMRTLSANIAVEMPEAEVDSSHYRILFLAGLVLFIFTFFFNTIGELVRQRLRHRYGSL